MILIRCFLPGRFEDAQLYMGRLLLLRDDYSIQHCHLRSLAARVAARYPEAAQVAELFFLRNDWLHEHGVESLLAHANIRSALRHAVEPATLQPVRIEPNEIQFEHEPAALGSRVVLDWLIYCQRMYFAAENGVFHQNCDWEADDFFAVERPVQRLDARCIALSAKYGAVNASCTSDGLHVAFDEFHAAAMSEGPVKMRQVAPRSMRTMWAAADIANYPTNVRVELFCSQTAKPERPDPSLERTVVTDLGPSSDLFRDLWPAQGNLQIEPERVQFVFNDGRLFFVHELGGRFVSARIERPKNGKPRVRHSQIQKGRDTRILSAHPMGAGTVIESADRVWLYQREQWHTLFDGPVLNVRTFERAKHYRNLIAITVEDGVHIVAAFDEDDPAARAAR